MKKKLVILLLVVFTPLRALAVCGEIPNPPQILEFPQLNAEQVKTTKGDLETYAIVVTEYKDCIDQKISQIAPSDAPIEYFESSEYQTQFDSYAKLMAVADKRLSLAIERFNYLLENSN